MPSNVQQDKPEQAMGDFERFRATFPDDLEQTHTPIVVDTASTKGLKMARPDDGRTFGHAKKGNGMQIISVSEH